MLKKITLQSYNYKRAWIKKSNENILTFESEKENPIFNIENY